MEYFDVVAADEQLRRLVRKANCPGPQHVAVDGEAVVVPGEMEYLRLLLASAHHHAGPDGARPGRVMDPEAAREPGASMFTMLRRPFEEAAARGEDVYWPWDRDCEKREWVLPEDHAATSHLTRRCV